MTLPDDIELRQDISDIEMYTKDGEAIDFIHPEHLDKIMELVNKYNGTVDLTKPKVNLIDIASPNMTPEASKAVDYALERSMEKMRATPESNERKMVTIAVDKNLIPTVWCDPEIADLVTALNLAEIPTIASCSGHGFRNGNIALEDGRELIIAENFEEARSIENAVQEAENIRLTRLAPTDHADGNQMTTYNERLDRVLSDYATAIGSYVNFGSPFNSDEDNIAGAEALYQTSYNEAKQAITSLIKELVAEAKPMVVSKEVIETCLQNGMTQKAAEYHGRNHAVDQYEQNLLKALEEL